jgi:hypothetical protein
MEIQSLTRPTPRLAYTCPHCSGVLDLTPLLPAPEATKATATSPSEAEAVPDAPVRWSPLLGLLHQLATPGSPLPTLPRWLRWWLSALLLLTLLGALIWQLWSTPAAPAPMPSAAAGTVAGVPPERAAFASFTADQAAVLSVVAAYNAAEAEIGQTLSLDPILPLLVPDGPLAQRRAQEIAQRRQANATHATRLLRWAVGAVSVDAAGTTATLITQETWEDQIGAQLPRTATVRVAYTLRRADAQSAWRIVDAQSTVL